MYPNSGSRSRYRSRYRLSGDLLAFRDLCTRRSGAVYNELAKNTKLFSLSLLGRDHASDPFCPQMEEVEELDDGRPTLIINSF